MQLHRMKAKGKGKIFQALWIRMIDEDSNHCHESWKRFDDLRGARSIERSEDSFRKSSSRWRLRQEVRRHAHRTHR
jgi:hypothetical protein